MGPFFLLVHMKLPFAVQASNLPIFTKRRGKKLKLKQGSPSYSWPRTKAWKIMGRGRLKLTERTSKGTHQKAGIKHMSVLMIRDVAQEACCARVGKRKEKKKTRPGIKIQSVRLLSAADLTDARPAPLILFLNDVAQPCRVMMRRALVRYPYVTIPRARVILRSRINSGPWLGSGCR